MRSVLLGPNTQGFHRHQAQQVLIGKRTIG